MHTFINTKVNHSTCKQISQQVFKSVNYTNVHTTHDVWYVQDKCTLWTQLATALTILSNSSWKRAVGSLHSRAFLDYSSRHAVWVPNPIPPPHPCPSPFRSNDALSDRSLRTQTWIVTGMGPDRLAFLQSCSSFTDLMDLCRTGLSVSQLVS